MNKKDSAVKKDIVIDDMTIKVVKKNLSSKKLINYGVITEKDAEMDKRAKAAVSIAKRQAKICNKPIAVYDKKQNEPILVNTSGV